MASFVTEFKHLEIQLEDIISATNNFDESKVIGKGGFGKVYAGELSHSQSGEKSLVAIKRLDRRYGQGDPEFFKEIRMLSCYRHENLISLLGFCCQGDEMILIYEYASRGSLDRYLSSADLTWTERLRICIDAAKGLSFLHDPNGTQQRVLHCDIKSANILLDNNMTAKVSDFGLSKMGPANQQYSLLVTSAVGTIGYCDPLYMQTYSLTKESDVYSFGVVLFEVMCGRLCAENTNGRLNVYVPFWRKCYEKNKLDEIILKDIRQQMDPSSMKTFSDIASQCLRNAREERPTMSLVVEKLQIALQMQVLPKEYKKIANDAVDPLLYRSLEEFKELISKGVLLNGGKTWLSLNQKEEHHIMVSIEEYLSLDDPNRDCNDRYSSKENSRFAVDCYKTRLMEFKLRVTAPLFLSPDVTYGLNLVLHASEIDGMKQQYVGVRYKIQGERKISILHFADKKECKQLVAELYQFNSTEESILDLEILLEDCGLSGDFYIEGIEFLPLDKVEHQVVIANREIVRGLVPPLFYRFTEEESKVLLSEGVLLNRGKTWLSINNKREHCVLISIEDCLILDKKNWNDSDRFSLEEDSRFAVGCYKAYSMNFKILVRNPVILSPHVTYGLNLVLHASEIEGMKQQYVGVGYKLQGETKISILHLADKQEGKQLVAELYQFNSTEECIQDLEIFLEDCGLSGDFYIEGIEFRPLEKVEHQVVIANQEIVRGLVPPLFYKFTVEESKVLLSQGVLLNRGKTWLSINNKRELCALISIEDCLIRGEGNCSRFSLEKDSRFAGGCYNPYSMDFNIRVRTPFILSPHVTYGMYLIFQYTNRMQTKQQSFPIRYKLQGETKISIVHYADAREDEWLVAELYQFISEEDKSILDIEIVFERCGLSGDFYIEGIEFLPLEKVEHSVREYEEILKAAVPHVFYRSAEELKVLLSRGILLNGGKMWFSINDKEEHCLMLSIEDCLVRDVQCSCKLHENSRFAGDCYTKSMNFKIRVRTPLFLSPCVRYRLSLVFKHSGMWENIESFPIWYKLQGEEKMSIVHLADQKEDVWLVAELYQFINDGDKSILDLEIIFEKCGFPGLLYIDGIEFQPLGRVEHAVVVVEYEEILKGAVTPVFYTSVEELKLLLTRGIILNGCKTWLSINEKGEHIERIYIEACLNPDKYNRLKPPSDFNIVNSRFPGGRCYVYDMEFKASVRAEYLTPQISYKLNLVFRYKYESDVNEYNYPLRYKIDGDDETKVFIIYATDMRKEGWFIVPLYHFASQHATADLQFECELRGTELLVAGIEFQPSEEKVELQVYEEYKDIVGVASQSLFYTSLDELKQILAKGVHLNGYKTWFSLNEKGEHCHMISVKDCLIPNEDSTPQYDSHSKSRFPAGFYQTNDKGFKTHVKAQLLSPKITYTVNLVYNSSSYGEQVYVGLKYRLRGEATTSVVYLANRRQEDWLHMVELYQFISDGSIIDFEIIFENSGTNIDGVEGIMFQPLEIVEDQVSKKDKVENIQTISDSESNTYWEQKLPNDYEEVLKLSTDNQQWTTKKELYSILRRGFITDYGQQWFAFDNHEKKCLMLSARATWVIDDKDSACESSHESRFGEVLVITSGYKFEIEGEIKSELVSPETNYASYLVYKLPQDQSTFEAPMYEWEQDGSMYAGWYIYLVSPPHTPVLGPKLEENNYNPLNRYKWNAIPHQRSDGWMEVKVWEFQTTTKSVPMHLYLEHVGKKDLKGLMVQGIEIRPI